MTAGWSYRELSVAIYLDTLAQWTGRDQRLLWPPERELARRAAQSKHPTAMER